MTLAECMYCYFSFDALLIRVELAVEEVGGLDS